MWKTRTKISKILTNIHAGFVTALLGCVLTFAPLNAMGASVCATNAVTTGAEYINESPTNCKTVTTKGYGASTTSAGAKYALYSCSQCKSGYTSVTNTMTYGDCTGMTYNTCSFNSNCSATTYSYTDCGGITSGNSVQNCASSTAYCFGGVRVVTCNTCKGSLSKVSKSVTPDGCKTSYSYNDCASCTLASQCGTDATTYSDSGYTGCEQKMYNTCSSGTCGTGYNRRCKAGYYGTPESSCSGACTACESDSKSGVAGTSAAGSDEIGDCYIPSGEPFTDNIGSGTYSAACYY